MKKQNMKSGDLLALSLELNTLGVMHKIVHASVAAVSRADRQALAAIGAVGEIAEPGAVALKIVPNTSNQPADSEEKLYTTNILKALASARDITYHLQNAHWTVRSSSFAEHHKFFNDAYDLFWDLQDRLAEQLRAFDISVQIPNNPDALRAFSLIDITSVQASVPKGSYESRFIVHLSYYAVFLDRIISLLKELYKSSQTPEINDPAGETLFGDILRELTKQRWMVRAYKTVDEDANDLQHSQETAQHDMQERAKNAYKF